MHKWKTTQPYKEKLKPTDTSYMNGSQKSLPEGNRTQKAMDYTSPFTEVLEKGKAVM